MVPEGLLLVVSAHSGCRSFVCAPVGLLGEHGAAAMTCFTARHAGRTGGGHCPVLHCRCSWTLQLPEPTLAFSPVRAAPALRRRWLCPSAAVAG